MSNYKRAIRISALAAAVALAAAACGGGGSSSSSSGGEIDPDAVIHVSTAAPSRNLDPHLQTSYGGWGMLTPIYDRLTMVDADGNITPGLAKSWEFADDGSQLKMSLRDDVTFNDGTQLDAQAVADNIDRGKSLPDSAVVDQLSAISSVDVVDPQTVHMNLREGSGIDLPGVFTTNVGMMISPEAITAGADIRNDPGDAGSGAYIVASYTPSESLTLKRSDNDYWDPEGGRVAGIEIMSTSNASTRLNGIRTGVTDLTWVSSANEIVEAKNLEGQGSYQINEVEYQNVLSLMMRPYGDLENLEVREAVARAIDPEGIDALFSGTCTPYRQLNPASSWATDPDYKYPFTYDADKAKQMVEDAGGAAITLTFSAGANTEKSANVLQSQLTAAGIDVELDPVPYSQAEPRTAAGDFQAVITNSFQPSPDPATTVAKFVTGAYEFSGGDPGISTLAEQAADPTLSQDKRADLYKEIWSQTLDEALVVPICHQLQVAVANDKVVDVDDIPWVNIGVFDIRTISMTK